MCSDARLRGLFDAVRTVEDRKIPGDIVECGTARGGSLVLMGLALHLFGGQRCLWAFDTFEGLPPPTPEDPDEKIARAYTGLCRGEIDQVTALLKEHRLDSCTNLVKGLFQETLSHTNTGPIAVLHLDGDWYASLKVCLEQLYDRVSPGGIIQIDDYGHWQGAKKVVDEFFYSRSMKVVLKKLDYTGRQFTKY